MHVITLYICHNPTHLPLCSVSRSILVELVSTQLYFINRFEVRPLFYVSPHHPSFSLVFPSPVKLHCFYLHIKTIRTAYQMMEKNLKLFVPTSYNAWGVAEISEEDTEFARSTKSHSHTNMMVMQVVAYTLVAFVANAANLSHLREKDMGEEPNLELSTMRMILQIVHSAVRPSQGLLNFVVFLG